MLYLGIIIRALIIYFFIIIAIRVFGKREISQLSVVDLVFILLISNSVQNAMVGPDNSLLGGVVAAGTLFVVNKGMECVIMRSKTANRLLQGEPVMLVYNGHIIRRHLEKSGISVDELEAAIREHGVEKVEDVNLAVLETDGNISVLSDNFQKHTLRKHKAHRAISKNY